MSVPLSGFDSVVGRWHIVAVDADSRELPEHRVDIVIREGDSELTGAVLSRIDGSELRHVALLVRFDGETLKLKMEDRRVAERPDAPWLVLNERLEGRWHDAAGQPIGPTLKLVPGNRSA